MKNVRNFFILAVVFFCVGIPFALDIPTYLKMKNGDIVNLDEVEAFALERGDVVEGNVNRVLGCCAEEYTTNFGIRTSDRSDKLYYVIWLNNDNFIVYCTSSSSDYTKLDQITEETYAYLESLATYDETKDYEDLQLPATELKIQGTVSKLPSNIEGFFREWYQEAVDEEYGSFDECCEPLMITHARLGNLKTTIMIGAIFAAAGVLMLILGIIFAIRNKIASRNAMNW